MFKFAILLLFPSIAFAANVKDYGAICDGINDDTAAIQTTIDENNLIEFPAGKCFISNTLKINKSVVLRGVSRQLSGLKWTDISMNGVEIITNAQVQIQQMAFHASLNAVAGNSVHITGDTVNAFSTIKDCMFVGGWNQFYTTAAYAWILDGNYHYGYVNAGIVVRNTFNADWGDSTIVNSVMSGGGPNSTSIYQISSGGLRIVNNKLLGGAYAYRWQFNGNEVTSDLIISNNSIENQTVAAMRFGTNTSISFANIVIDGNQFMNQPIVIAMDSANRFMSRVVINDNSMSVVSQYGIILTNVEDFVVSDNQITGINGSFNGIAIGANSQNGRVDGNRTKGFATGIVNNSLSTTVSN
jgi:hypothetical protein